MSRIILRGSLAHRCRSVTTLLATTVGVLARRAIGRPLVRGWPTSFEIGTLFYRRQFNHAFALPSIVQGRAYFDSLCTLAQTDLPVQIRPSEPGEPAGDWFIPHGHSSRQILLYFHGGGYAFHAAVTRQFIALLALRLQMPIFSLNYRLTPEHPHPAQRDDALMAYRWLLKSGLPPTQLLLGGDSAGGHMVLMTLVALREAGLPQPALALALSPWTDIGRRGASQFGYDRYDMVQGYQTLKYGEWLKGDGGWTDAQLSPIAQDLRHLAPMYIQAGGKEILVDMIRDFALKAQTQGAQVRLEVWPDMTHEFHAYADMLPQSRHALERLRRAVAWTQGGGFEPEAQTELDTLAAAGDGQHREDQA